MVLGSSPVTVISNDIYIYFAAEKELGKILILKKHADTLRSILNFNEIRRLQGCFPRNMSNNFRTQIQ